MNYYFVGTLLLLVFLFLNYVFLRSILPFLNLYLLDNPNYRSSHFNPTPSAGGISFIILSLLISLFSIKSNGFMPINAIPIICLPLGLIGFLDDLYGVNRFLRYLSQFLTSMFLVKISSLELAFNTDSLVIKFIVFITLTIFCTAIINFVNFMDGIDGLISGTLASSILYVVLVLNLPITYWAIVGSVLGFLVLNWSPAKVFMGDTGSTYLGATYAGICLQANNYSQTFSFLLILSPVLFDALICLFRRLQARHNIFKPHSLHLYQRLYKAGISHSSISCLYLIATSLNGFVYLFFGINYLLFICTIELIIGFYLDQKRSVPFLS